MTAAQPSSIVTAPMALYLVRHAKAGQRSRWDGPDHLRPLTKAGRAQAQALAAWLANEPISRLLSSPYVRCVQTLEPLAEKLALEIEITEHLTEAIHFGPALGPAGGGPRPQRALQPRRPDPRHHGGAGPAGHRHRRAGGLAQGQHLGAAVRGGEVIRAHAVAPPDAG